MKHDKTAYGCKKWTGDRAGVDLRAICPACSTEGILPYASWRDVILVVVIVALCLGWGWMM